MARISHHETGPRIKTARRSTGLSLDKFAARVGITTRHLVRLENGENRPRRDLAARIETVTEDLTGTKQERILPDTEDEEADMAFAKQLAVMFQQAIDVAVRREFQAEHVVERVMEYVEAGRR